MSSALNDLWVAYLKGAGYEGESYNTLTANALREATGADKHSTNTLWYIYLAGLGYSGVLNDMWYAWLGDNGYTGALPDRWKAALEDGFAFFGFDPLTLFDQGQQGVFYSPWDLNTLFQDSAGTTPVTADGDPVGLMLDKSGNGNHASQATSLAKPVYRTDGVRHWLEFDGSAYLATSDIDFSLVDEAVVATAFSRVDASSTRCIVECSYPNNGFGLFSAPSSGNGSIFYASGGDAFTRSTLHPYPDGVGVVAVGGSSVSPPLSQLRINGQLVDEDNRTQGAGGYSKAPLGVGARATGDWGSRGPLYGLVVVNQIQDASINRLEKYLASKSGVTLT